MPPMTEFISRGKANQFRTYPKYLNVISKQRREMNLTTTTLLSEELRRIITVHSPFCQWRNPCARECIVFTTLLDFFDDLHLVYRQLCKHVFSEDGIKSYFSDGRRKKCPGAGCSREQALSDYVVRPSHATCCLNTYFTFAARQWICETGASAPSSREAEGTGNGRGR